MVEAETNLSWIPLREAISLGARRLEYAEEYARVWIIREAAGDRIKARGKTPEGWNVSILAAAWRGVVDSGQLMRSRTLLPVTSVGVIDRVAGMLRFPREPWEIISNVELCLDGLVTAALLPAPQDNAAGREGWWAAQLFAWMIGEEPAELLPAQLELTRKIRAGLITPWDMSKPDEPKRVPLDQFHLSRWRTTIVNVYGELTTWPAPKNEGDHKYRMMFYADQSKRVFPQLDWLREEAKRYAAVVCAGLSKLNDLIALAEANRTDWTRFVELVAMIGGNLENLTPEESAAVRLVNGFSSARANAELRRALHEAEKIRRRIGDRFTEAVRAGQLEIKGRRDLKVLVTIPRNFVTTDLIWSLLRSSELVIAGQHYVDVQIGPPESPETVHETQRAEEPEELVEHKVAPGPKPGGFPKQQAMCEAAKNILNNNRRRPKPQGRNAAIARMLRKQKAFKDYRPATIEDYIRSEVRKWEKKNPDK